ncbi:transposable element Tcb1 transposase [Trichonephila clavipes]|nr:transposable element Tcb1 transposase [Trichonephila clavipes]
MACQVTRSFANRACLRRAGKATAAVPRYRRINCADAKTMAGFSTGGHKEIGSRNGRNQTTVMRICDRWMLEATTDRRGLSNPPQCTTSREERQILCMVVTDHSVASQTV